jgi:hypothetical protein
MIPSPNSYYTDEEAKAAGADLRVVYTIHPFYFSAGMVGGSFINTHLVGGVRVQLDDGAESGSWTSDPLLNRSALWPTSVVFFWESASPGFDMVVEYRTAGSVDELLLADWTVMEMYDEILIDHYYQWRVSWQVIRSFFFDTEQPDDPAQAYFLDTFDPDDPYISYMTDGTGSAVYLTDMTLVGEYAIPPGDVKSSGELTLACPKDFSDLTSGDHSLTLINRGGVYSPGNPAFIFADEGFWYLKGIRVETGYLRPGTRIIDRVTIFDGLIMGWGPVTHAIDSNGKMQENTVEIRARDRIAYLLQKTIGTPASDGTPQPVVFGDLFKEATQLTDKMVGDTARSANFDGDNLYELDNTTTSGTATITLNHDNPYTGLGCCRLQASGAAASAVGIIDLVQEAHSFLFTGMVCFTAYPVTTPSARLLAITGTGSTLYLIATPTGRVILQLNGSSYDTSWFIDDLPGIYRRLSVGIYGGTSGVLKVWVDGSEVYSSTGNYSSLIWRYISIDLTIGAYTQDWTVDWDALQVYNSFLPHLYQLSGFPFEDITQVMVDGSIRLDKTQSGATVSRIIAGRNPGASAITLYPEEGVVSFDPANPPGGTVTFRARANAITHPVDMLSALITLAGAASFIDTANFASVKESLPNDAVYGYFDNVAAGDAIKEITSRCLIGVYMDQGKIKLQAYDGTPPSSYVRAIGTSEAPSVIEEVRMEELRTKVTGKFGNYEQNRKLYYEANNTQGQAFLGTQQLDMDFAWGASVVSESQAMVKEKVDAMLKRLGAQDILQVTGRLFRFVRLEIGDTVQINIPLLRTGVVYRVFTKTLYLNPPFGVDLELVRFLGEE